jgi:hypothetical protein
MDCESDPTGGAGRTERTPCRLSIRMPVGSPDRPFRVTWTNTPLVYVPTIPNSRAIDRMARVYSLVISTFLAPDGWLERAALPFEAELNTVGHTRCALSNSSCAGVPVECSRDEAHHHRRCREARRSLEPSHGPAYRIPRTARCDHPGARPPEALPIRACRTPS